MSVCLLMIGDGRDEYHERAHASLLEMAVVDAFDATVVIDDREHKLGFAGAIQRGWERAISTGADHIFHLEMDFTFSERIDIAGMIELLRDQPHLVQVALKRQPVNEAEVAAGGLVEQAPDDYRQRVQGGRIWTEHRRYFTTNPSVYSTSLCRHGWPQVPHSEGVFSHRLLQDPEARFAMWGAKFDAPLVHHIGEARRGRGY